MRALTLVSLSLLLSACGGGDSGGQSSVPTAGGYFKDSNTQGLRYVSRSQSGVTGSNGSFSYEIGQPVSFFVGALPLGTVNVGQSVVTPLDLVTSGTTSDLAVQNRVRFLMALDADGNPANGIVISPAVQAAAANWTALDFTLDEASFNIAASPLLNLAKVSTPLPSVALAQSHLESTLRCVRSGGYSGTYSGTDTGAIGVMVDATTGMASGYYSSSVTAGTPVALAGSSASAFDQGGSFATGSATSGTSFSGAYNSPDAITGNWASAGTPAGSFSLSRVGGLPGALYRFTGTFSGTSYGLFTFDVDAANKVTGMAYDVGANSLVTLTGTVSAGTLTASSAAGAQVTGFLNTASGTLQGTWTMTSGTGFFTGTGCKLN